MAFLSTSVVLVAIVGANAVAIDDGVRRLVLTLTHEDVAEDSGANDTLLRAYLASRPSPGVTEVAVIGASYVATLYETNPEARLYRVLERRLTAETGRRWRVANLASPGYDLWSYFFMARLVRNRRPPQVLIVSLDAFKPMGRNRHLVLNNGDALAQFSAWDLSEVVASNQLLLFRTEAWLLHRVRPYTGWLETVTRLRRLERAVGPLARTVVAGVTGRPYTANNELTPDGRRKSWRQVPRSRSQIDAMRKAGPRSMSLDDGTLQDLKRLGLELEACSRAGIRVFVVTMPRNPVVPADYVPIHRSLTDWARQHGLEFHDYLGSGIARDDSFSDTGHFFGDGARAMAEQLAGLIVGGVR